jgi:hypothetical protein
MVTVTCTDNDCPNGGIDYNVLGSPAQVECGGCHVMLAPTDERPDPPAMPFIESPESSNS